MRTAIPSNIGIYVCAQCVDHEHQVMSCVGFLTDCMYHVYPSDPSVRPLMAAAGQLLFLAISGAIMVNKVVNRLSWTLPRPRN